MSDSSIPMLQIQELGNVTVVCFNDRKILGEEEIREFRKELSDLLSGCQYSRIVFDLRKVESLPSGALGELFKLKKRLATSQGTLKLCNLQPDLLEVFSITRLNTIFEIYPDDSSAMASFQSMSPREDSVESLRFEPGL